ncbi:MAG: hypothetical protein UX17_C0001G0017 [Parcubacteria group bacterium GW2011_GWC2_45_7]|nr:MAG: hypothetical protein UX17_C0001G0017 [Parcubacteria group bacterium GW2011_GWC2_45_7]KKU74091.1 MAG: hypothetical protein UX98_C0001G0021 [Parcubacteria group bacterium GW2011_GWA2_47_26]
MFTFLKLIKPLFLPTTLVAAGMFVSLLFLVCKNVRWGRRILGVTLVVYYLLSIHPVAYMLASSLEKKIPPATIDSTTVKNAEVIVILAGGAQKAMGYRPFAELGGTSWRRLWQGIKLFKLADDEVPILYSGGSGDPFDPVSEEAEIAKQYGSIIGIPEDMFWIESGSRDTYESSLAVKNFLDERFPNKEIHQIVLVTSAWHMPRSLKAMSKVGVMAIPYPADFSAGALNLTPLSFFPSVTRFSSSVGSIHEWIGMLGYKLRKRI